MDKSFREYLTEMGTIKIQNNEKRLKILNYIKKTPTFDIPDLYNYAKTLKLFDHELNEILISLLKEYVNYTQIKKVEELQTGCSIEKEHKPTYDFLKAYIKVNDKMPPEKEVYEHIAKDHLKEFKNYYSGLADLEKKLENKIVETK